jgi:hypothetical protein
MQKYQKPSQALWEARKQKWKQRKTNVDAGTDPQEIRTFERAEKALTILRMDFDSGKAMLEDGERETYIAIVVKKCTEDFYFFCKYVLGFTLMRVEPHKRWCVDLLKAIILGKKRMMRLKPRGSYKSSIYGIGFLLWLWGCVNLSIRIFYTSVNKLLLDEIADALSQHVGTDKNETFYSYLFGVTKDSDVKNTTDVFNIQGRVGKGFSLILRTSGGNTVGIHPNIIIIDDPCGREDQLYETERKSKETWFDTLVPLLVPFYDDKNGLEFNSIFYIGTRWHMKDLVYYIEEQLVKKKGQKWDIESESITTDGTPDGPPAYPDFFPSEQIKDMRDSMSSEFFAAQYLNKPQSLDTVVFDINRLTFIRPDQFDMIKDKGQKLCAFDPSLGKKSSDYPFVWFLHYYNNVITFFDAIDKKIEIAMLLNLIAEKCKSYNCKTIYYESNNTILMEENLKMAFDKIGWNMNYESIHHGSDSNKRERIVSCQPDLYSGSAQFMDDYLERYSEGMNQIVFYGSWDHDDSPDTMELGISYFKQTRFQFVRYEGML